MRGATRDARREGRRGALDLKHNGVEDVGGCGDAEGEVRDGSAVPLPASLDDACVVVEEKKVARSDRRGILVNVE